MLAGLALVIVGLEIPAQHYTATDPDSAAWTWIWAVLCVGVGVLTLAVGATRP
jgi:adenine-specific DNA methylase